MRLTVTPCKSNSRRDSMPKVVQFGVKGQRRGKHPSTDLSVSSAAAIFPEADLRNLIDSWIVPKLVDEWMNQTADTERDANDDNGEQS